MSAAGRLDMPICVANHYCGADGVDCVHVDVDAQEARIAELERTLQVVCDHLTAALLVKRWDDARKHVDQACETLRRGQKP
jgi:hypothetical protein